MKTGSSAVARNRRAKSTPEISSARELRLGPLTDYIGYRLRRAYMRTVAGFLEALEEIDLRPTQFSVLALIHENPGVSQTEVCAALGIQKANFVPLLKELQRRGLAVRKSGVADRRSSALHLTEQGAAVLRRAFELHDAWDAKLAASLGPGGREQLLELLGKLI